MPAAVAGLLLAAAWVAPAAEADSPCVYDDAALTITYALPTTGSTIPLVQRSGSGGKEIYIGTESGGSGDLCNDPDSSVHATVDNTNTITLTGNPVPGVQGQNPRLEFGFSNGRLEPGATLEANGSEIEVNVPDVTGSFVIRTGRSNKEGTTPGNDHYLAGAKGINFNADEATKDLDVTVGSGSGGLTGVVFYGGEGNDELSVTGDAATGGPTTSYNNLNGQEGNDKVDMTGTPDSFSSLTGGPGDDELKGNGLRGFSATSMSFGSTSTPVTVDLGNASPQLISAEQGTDTISGVYNVYGGSGADTLSGDAGINWIGGDASGGSGSSTDTIHGGAGGDQLSGGPGGDHLFGEAGADGLNGEEGEDELRGGAENDSLDGDISGAAPDLMFGEGGDDGIELDAGDDTIDGGEGSDEIRSSGASGGLSIDFTLSTTTNPGLGTDNLAGMENVAGTSGFADTLKGDNGPNKLSGNGKGDHLEGRGGNDTLFVSTVGEATEIDGGGGDDLIVGSIGPDTIAGGAGKDTISSSNGEDTISAPAEGEQDTVNCGFEADTVTSYDAGLDLLTACETTEGGEGGSGGGGSSAGGGGSGAAAGAATTLGSVPAPMPGMTKPGIKRPAKPLKCKKGFKKKKVKGKTRCVKVKKHG